MTDKKPIEKIPMNFMANEFMDQQLTTLNQDKSATDPKNELSNSVSSDLPKVKDKLKEDKKMMMPPMGPPVESTWEEIVVGLKIQIANAEKNLLMVKAQLKEAESHIDKTD